MARLPMTPEEVAASYDAQEAEAPYLTLPVSLTQTADHPAH
jgi:hypothetical protein